MFERKCPGCLHTFKAQGNRAVHCSIACKNWVRRHPGVVRDLRRTCDGCPSLFVATHAAERYCTTKCRSAAEKRRNRVGVREYRPALEQCKACGDPMPAGRIAGSIYCSDRCGDRYYRAPDRFTLRFGRTCERCGTGLPSTERLNRRYCTVTCQVLTNQEIRRARKRGLPCERLSRAEVFDRDDMTCHLCALPIDALPVLDHVIPLALPDSPGHVWENVAAAHGRCNQSKRDRVTDHDYALYARLRAERVAREAGCPPTLTAPAATTSPAPRPRSPTPSTTGCSPSTA